MKYISILDLWFESIHSIVPKITEMMKTNFIHVFHLRMIRSSVLMLLRANAVNATKTRSCTVIDCKLLLLHILSRFKGTDKCVF